MKRRRRSYTPTADGWEQTLPPSIRVRLRGVCQRCRSPVEYRGERLWWCDPLSTVRHDCGPL